MMMMMVMTMVMTMMMMIITIITIIITIIIITSHFSTALFPKATPGHNALTMQKNNDSKKN